jgi:hypothetical protein
MADTQNSCPPTLGIRGANITENVEGIAGRVTEIDDTTRGLNQWSGDDS